LVKGIEQGFGVHSVQVKHQLLDVQFFGGKYFLALLVGRLVGLGEGETCHALDLGVAVIFDEDILVLGVGDVSVDTQLVAADVGFKEQPQEAVRVIL